MTAAHSLLLGLALAAVPPAPADLSDAHRLLSLVDYLSADYPVAVADGRVTSQPEHAEHIALAAEAQSLARALPPLAERPDALIRIGRELEAVSQAIDAIADPRVVAGHCAEIHTLLVEGYRLPTFPRTSVDLARGRSLYLQACSACHADDGSGATAIAERLEPRPRPLAGADMDLNLSPQRVFNGVSFGIPGTAMPSFGENVPVEDRWAIAFHVLALRQPGDPPPGAAEAFEKAGLSPAAADLAVQSDAGLRARARASGLDPAAAQAATVYARRVAPTLAPESPLALARRLLAESVANHREGRAEAARRAALDSYLRGVEPVEGVLRGTHPRLVSRIETAYLHLRESIRSGAAAGRLAAQADALDALLVEAGRTLAGNSRSPWYAFLGALAIVLREGVEAALIVGAMLAILGRAAPQEAALARSVHRGWVAALALGLLTWLGAETLIDLSAGGREAMEGVIALLASVLLFAASYWLLANRDTRRWMDFLTRRVKASGARGGSWSLFGMAFLAVYREVFETVLFLQALLLGAPAGRWHAGLGIGTGMLLLVAVVAAVFGWGRRLPLKPFFVLSSALLALLSFVLAGQGVHALQIAGWLPAPAVALPSLPSFGIHPTLPGLAVQGLILLLFAGAGVYSLVAGGGRERRG